MDKRKATNIPSLLEQGVSIISADYVIEYQSQTLLESFGDVKGRRCYKVFFGRKEPCATCALRRAIDSGARETQVVASSNGRIYAFQFIPFTDTGGATKVMEIVTDITDRKLAEEALRVSEEKYRALTQAALDAIITIGGGGKILFWNNSAERMFGYTTEEAVGKEVTKLIIPPRYREAMLGGLKKFSETGTGPVISKVVEGAALRKDGTEFPIEISIAAMRVKDEWQSVAIARDITERIQAKQALQEKNEQLDAQNEELQSQGEDLVAQRQELMEKTKELEMASQTKSEFLASMSHELRTPLNAVIGFSELMLDGIPGEINDDQRQCLDDILNSGKHLLNLINDVLDLSKLEAGRMEFKMENLQLADVVHEAVQTVKPLLVENEHRMSINMGEGRVQVHADKTRLRQILLNLLSNAIKFTPPGGDLSVEAHREGDWCQISVLDNGIGIKKENQDRLFDAFTQINTSPERKREGTGLGLALTRQLVEASGGRIWAESEHGNGSKFVFTIPLAREGETGNVQEDINCGG